MTLKTAFIYIAQDVDSHKHRHTLVTPNVELTVIAVNDYDDALAVSRSLVANGITEIELCAGFGSVGTAIISDAVRGKAVVGAVRFDVHPDLNFRSGDEVFNIQKVQDF